MSKMIVITAEELETIFDARLKVALEKYAPHAAAHQDIVPGQAAPPYVNKREAARLIGVCVSTIDNAARAGKIKRHYVGEKAVRFERVQVLALAKSHTNLKK